MFCIFGLCAGMRLSSGKLNKVESRINWVKICGATLHCRQEFQMLVLLLPLCSSVLGTTWTLQRRLNGMLSRNVLQRISLRDTGLLHRRSFVCDVITGQDLQIEA